MYANIAKLVQKDDLVSGNDGKVLHMRAFLQFGLPLSVNGIRFDNVGDRKDD